MRLRMATPSACACACSASDNNSESCFTGVNESLRSRGGAQGDESIDDEGDECNGLGGVESDARGPPTCAWRFPRCICCSNKDSLRGVREGEEDRIEFDIDIELELKLEDGVCGDRECCGMSMVSWTWRVDDCSSAYSSMSRATSAITCSMGTCEVPSGVRILPRMPELHASTSNVAMSDSISSKTSPAWKCSPSFFLQRLMVPSAIKGDMAGIIIAAWRFDDPEMPRLRERPNDDDLPARGITGTLAQGIALMSLTGERKKLDEGMVMSCAYGSNLHRRGG